MAGFDTNLEMSQSVAQQVCTGCGAQNRGDADFCWQCYTPFRGGRSSTQERTTPLARAVSGRSATAVPKEMRPQRSSAVPPAVATIIRLAIVGGLVAGGWFAWKHFSGGFAFPDEIRGQARIEGETGSDIEELVRSAGELFDVEVEAALYGDLQSPTYVMYTYAIPEGQTVDEWLQSISSIPGGSEDIPFLTEITESGFACQVEAQMGAGCAWMNGERLLVGLAALGVTEEQVRPIAEEVRAETE